MMKEKKLGLFSAVSTGIGLIVATSCLVTLAQGVGYAGKGFLYAMVAVCILNLFIAFSFAELHSLMPISGGLGQYTLPALGPFFSILSVVGGYLMCNIFAASAEAAMIGIILSSTFMPTVPPLVISLVIVALLFLANLQGIDSFAKIQVFVTSIMVGSMILFGILGLFHLNSGEIVKQSTEVFNPMGIDVFSLTPLAFWLFIGIEYVTPIAKDLKNPEKNVPRAMIIGLVLLLVIQGVVAIAVFNYVPMNELTESPQPHVLFAQAMFGGFGAKWMAVISVAAATSTLNTVLASIPRMLAGLAKEGMLPNVLAKTNKKDVPAVGLYGLVIIFIIMLSSGISSAEKIIFMILTGCLFWMMAYIVAHVNVLVLRVKYKDRKRTFCVKFFHLPQILGIAGIIFMMFNIAPDPAMKMEIYKIALIWLSVLVVFAIIWIKVVMKKGLFETTSIDEVIANDAEGESNESADLVSEPVV